MKFYKSMKSLQNILWKWRDSHVPDPSQRWYHRSRNPAMSLRPGPSNSSTCQKVEKKESHSRNSWCQKFQETAREGTVNHLGIIPPLSITSTMYQRTVVQGSWLWTTKCRSESQAGRTNPAPVTLYIAISHKLQPQPLSVHVLTVRGG